MRGRVTKSPSPCKIKKNRLSDFFQCSSQIVDVFYHRLSGRGEASPLGNGWGTGWLKGFFFSHLCLSPPVPEIRILRDPTEPPQLRTQSYAWIRIQVVFNPKNFRFESSRDFRLLGKTFVSKVFRKSPTSGDFTKEKSQIFRP